jgi:hypothetical protein
MSMDLANFRVYNRTLTKDEIMKNYNSERNRYEILPSTMKNKLKMSFDANLSYSGTGTTITELSGAHSNGSIVNTGGYVAPTFSASTTLYPGKYFSFNGFNTKIEYGPIPLIENMSWEAWIRCVGTVSAPNTQLTGTVNMFMGQVLPYFGFQNDKILFSNYIGNSQTYLRSQSSLSLNKWYHVVGTTETVSNKTRSILYVNGVKSTESYEIGTQSKFSGSNYNFAIGDGQGTDRTINPTYTYPTQWYPFKGDVSQARVYYKTLSYEEVKNNYNSSKSVYENNLNDPNNFNSHELNGNPTFSIFQNMVLDIPGKANGSILRSDVDGKTSWVDKNYLFTKPNNYRYIGELYGGGIIVAMWKYPSNVSNYLIMSLEDPNLSGAIFTPKFATDVSGAVLYNYVGATSEHNGNTNTSVIIAQVNHNSSAAKLCRDYRGGGFADWYLPSLTELNYGFNAGQIVDSVLGTDKLNGTYWSSTEIDANNVYSYDFNNTTDKKASINAVSKNNFFKIRPFRQVQVYDTFRPWREEWDIEYTPIWGRPYPWDEVNWLFTTSITIGTEPVINDLSTIFNENSLYMSGTMSFTFSNTVTTNETIINTGICWATSSTTPTISNSFTYSQSGGPTNFNAITSEITGPLPPLGIAYSNQQYYKYLIYFRAFVTTSSGVYYSTNGNYPNGTTYSTSATTYATYPTNCYVYSKKVSFWRY